MIQRGKVVPLATGDVLEVGIGSGLNLPYYNSEQVRSVTGIDPSRETWSLLRDAVGQLPFEVMFEEGRAEQMPFEDDSFDSVVVTFTLCSIGPVGDALNEIRRVLRPGGAMFFSEHGKAPDRGVRRIQNGIEPIWKVFSGGCVLSRDMPKLITTEGFELSELKERYIPGWRPASYVYWGRAIPR